MENESKIIRIRAMSEHDQAILDRVDSDGIITTPTEKFRVIEAMGNNLFRVSPLGWEFVALASQVEDIAKPEDFDRNAVVRFADSVRSALSNDR